MFRRPTSGKCSAQDMDALSVAYHGYAHTHVDALWHVAVDDTSYNGTPRSLGFANGAPALSVLNLKQGIFTRGVLMWRRGLHLYRTLGAALGAGSVECRGSRGWTPCVCGPMAQGARCGDRGS